MHDLLFMNQFSLSDAKIDSFAKELGLNMGRFSKDMESSATYSQIEKEKEEAKKANLDSTPTIYINWGKYGEYELEVAADGLSAVGSAKGQPDNWRRMRNLGVLGTDLKQYAEHDH